ncbi:uncharacterized protein CYBJADRAFT_169138, partial [Cyberlindnera jadinii NRRL Y-1542]
APSAVETGEHSTTVEMGTHGQLRSQQRQRKGESAAGKEPVEAMEVIPPHKTQRLVQKEDTSSTGHNEHTNTHKQTK